MMKKSMRITIAAALFAALGSAGCQTTGVSDPDIRHY